MGTARVPLDDALVGRLPPVCVMSGRRAGGYAPMVVPRGLGIAWALLLAGPVGVLALVVLYPKLRTRYLVRLPMSDGAFDRWHHARVQRLWCAWLGLTGVALALATRSIGPLSSLIALAAIASLAVSVRAHWRVGWLQPSLSADPSGRWVTLRGVHPTFHASLSKR